MAEQERERCPRCNRLLPKPREQPLSPICKLCKKPLIKTGRFWVCSDLDMGHRGLIPHVRVKAAGWNKKPHEAFEV